MKLVSVGIMMWSLGRYSL